MTARICRGNGVNVENRALVEPEARVGIRRDNDVASPICARMPHSRRANVRSGSRTGHPISVSVNGRKGSTGDVAFSMHRIIVHQPGCRSEDPRIAFRANDCYGALRPSRCCSRAGIVKLTSG